MEKLLCGAAKADITPSESMLPMPLLGPLKFTHINDHIFVRALAFACGKERCLLLAFDLTIVPYAKVLLPALSEKLSLPQENIFVCATHTHETTPLGLPHVFPPEEGEAEKCRSWFEHIQAAAVGAARTRSATAGSTAAASHRNSPAGQRRTSFTTFSTWCVWGNISTGCTASTR